MPKTLQELKDSILDYTDEFNQLSSDILDIEKQIKLYKEGNLQMRPKTWYMKACTAYTCKKKQRFETSRMLRKLNMEYKGAAIDARNERTERECHIFYEKLKELLSPVELALFMEDVEKTLGEEVSVEDIAVPEEGEDGEALL